MSSSDSFAGDAPRRPSPPRMRSGPVVLEHGVKIYAVVVCAGGMHTAWSGETPESWAGVGVEGLLVGFLLGCAWALLGADTPTRDEGHAFARTQAHRNTQATRVFGYVEYPIKARIKLEKPVEVRPGACSVQRHAGALGSEQAALVLVGTVSGASSGDFKSLREAMSQWFGPKVSWGGELLVSPAAAYGMISGVWSSIKSVVVTQKINRKLLLAPSAPNRKRLAQFIRDMTLVGEAPQDTAATTRDPQRSHKPWASVLYSADLVLQ